MASTLIVRDATLAINGAPESRGDPRDHLRHRIDEVLAMDHETLAACAEVLRSSGTGEDTAVDILEAVTILGLAQPVIAERFGLSVLSAGRRLASRMEQSGDPDFGMAVLEILMEAFPNQTSLERDMSSLMRRQGMVNDLIHRYEDRAKRLLKDGKSHEAIGWLREVLLLDGSRKDVARLIRNLRLKQTKGTRSHRKFFRSVFLILIVSVGSTFLVLREMRLREEFRAIPAAETGNLESLRRRLSSIEAFLDANPIWHGSLFAIAERSGLRIEIDRLEQEKNLQERALQEHERELTESANLVRARARGRVESGDFAGAVEDLKLSLQLGPPNWEYRERVEKDIEAISQYLEENR